MLISPRIGAVLFHLNYHWFSELLHLYVNFAFIAGRIFINWCFSVVKGSTKSRLHVSWFKIKGTFIHISIFYLKYFFIYIFHWIILLNVNLVILFLLILLLDLFSYTKISPGSMYDVSTLKFWTRFLYHCIV